MKLFKTESIQQIPARDSHVFAFRISGKVSDDDSEAMAKFMNTAFDNADHVNMLMLLSDYTGSDWDSIFEPEVLESRFRSLSKVKKYAVVGAPERAARMIQAMDWVLPVDAKTFTEDDVGQAWDFVGSAPAQKAAA